MPLAQVLARHNPLGQLFKLAGTELGISRATANRRWRYGIAVIVWRLNGRTPPRKRSMAFVLAEAR